MLAHLYKKHTLTTSQWSGGSTTQLAIFPEDTLYSDRNFLWRLSSATVDTDTSDFTPLPGYNRILMVLQGEMTLAHSGYHTASLGAFEQDHFSGSWQSRSVGRVVDFNVMTREGIMADLVAHQLKPGHAIEIVLSLSAQVKHSFDAFYSVGKPAEIQMADQTFQLEPGDLLLIQRGETKSPCDETVSLTCGDEQSHIIHARIDIPTGYTAS